MHAINSIEQKEEENGVDHQRVKFPESWERQKRLFSYLMVLYGVVINTPTTANIANLDFFMYRLPNHAPQFIFPSLTMSMFIVGNVIGL